MTGEVKEKLTQILLIAVVVVKKLETVACIQEERRSNVLRLNTDMVCLNIC